MLKIAFCGPDESINSALTIAASKIIKAADVEVILVADPREVIDERTGRVDWSDSNVDWQNLWSHVERRIQVEQMVREGYAPAIISKNSGIDDVCHQAAWLGELMEKQKTGLSLVDAQGAPLVGDQGVWVNRAGATLQVILNSTEEEVTGENKWDFIYAAMPPGDPMGALELQYKDFLSTVPAFQDVLIVPYDTNEATEALKVEHKEKWQKILASS